MSPRILIVDSDRPQRDYISELMHEEGVAHVETADNSLEALNLIRTQEFDLVMTDLRMPAGDGIRVIQGMADLPKRPGLALMSASPKQLVRTVYLLAKLLAIDVVGQFCKPVSADEIRTLMNRLRESSASRSLPSASPRANDKQRMLEAMKNGEIQVWYQPKQAIDRGAITGAEALVRWVTPDDTVLLPASFLPAMVMHGLEKALTLHVLEQTLQAQAAWKAAGYPLNVSINLPSRLLDDRRLPDCLLRMVQEGGADPSSITFELTENSTTSLPSDYYAGACRLRMMGFGLAQDDFGQGYSSMHNLTTTPFTELKIDREFIERLVEDEQSQAVVESAIMMGSRMGLTVVAEGVETADQYEFLRRLGCDAVQGFYISGAMNRAILLHMLRQQHTSGMSPTIG